MHSMGGALVGTSTRRCVADVEVNIDLRCDELLLRVASFPYYHRVFIRDTVTQSVNCNWLVRNRRRHWCRMRLFLSVSASFIFARHRAEGTVTWM